MSVALSPDSPPRECTLIVDLCTRLFLGGSKVATRNNCTRAEESLGTRLVYQECMYNYNKIVSCVLICRALSAGSDNPTQPHQNLTGLHILHGNLLDTSCG